jgi:hypothetical protein
VNRPVGDTLPDQRIGHRCRHPANSAVNEDPFCNTCVLVNIFGPPAQVDYRSWTHVGRLRHASPALVRPTYSGAMSARWLVVLFTAAALVATPIVIGARHALPSDISANDLAARVQQSAPVAWSGFVETSGTLQVPDNESFATLAQLLGENTQLPVWWRIRTTGGSTGSGAPVRRTCSGSRDTPSAGSSNPRPQRIHLSPRFGCPTHPTCCPRPLARELMRDAREDELSRLPSRRVAGIDAPGLRLMPNESATTVAQVDIRAEPGSGLPLRVELYGVGEQRPVLTTTLLELSLSEPTAETTHFDPAQGVQVNYEQSVDVAAAANAFAPYDLPASLAGLRSRDG